MTLTCSGFKLSRILILISFSLLGSPSNAVTESELERSWEQLIDAPWRGCQSGQFLDDLKPSRKIAYRRCGSNVAGHPVLIIPGYTEPAMKYIELVGDLSSKLPELGPWYLLDLPGQGASERLVNPEESDERIVHVDLPERYPLAVIGIIKKIIGPENSNQPPRVIAHSTGALVLMSALQKDSEIVKSVVMTAPLIWPKTPFPNFFVALMARLHCRFGWCARPAWGRQTVPIEEKTFQSNISTTSHVRWMTSHKISLKYPEFYRSGTSWGWLKMSSALGSEIYRAERPMIAGTLMLMADDDGYIDPKPSFDACERSPGCQSVTMRGSRHEILQEMDSIRDRAIEKITRHFRSVF